MQNVIDFTTAALPFVLLGLALAVTLTAVFVERREKTLSRGRYTAGLVLMLLAVFSGWGGIAYADEAKPATTSDNVESVQMMLGDDTVWAGSNFEFSSYEAPNDILAAGSNIDVSNSTVNGSLRVAGSNLTVTNTTVAHGVTIAGMNIDLRGVSGKAVALAGQNITYDGECDSLYIAGSSVEISGTVHGDVYVSAETLTIADGTVIEGSVKAELGEEPTVGTTASVGSMDYDIHESDDSLAIFPSFGLVAGSAGVLAALSGLFGLLLVFLIGLFSELFARRKTKGASIMIKERTGAFIGSGVVGAIAAPVALIILAMLVVTLPVSAALLLVLIAIQIVAVGFTAASLGKLVFKKMRRIRCAMLSSVILGAICAIPVVGGIVSVLCFMYLLGYVIQSTYLSMRSTADEKGSAQPVAPVIEEA